MKYLLIIGTVLLTIGAVSLITAWAQRETTEDLYEEARLNRIRLLNQRGQGVEEINL